MNIIENISRAATKTRSNLGDAPRFPRKRNQKNEQRTKLSSVYADNIAKKTQTSTPDVFRFDGFVERLYAENIRLATENAQLLERERCQGMLISEAVEIENSENREVAKL